MQGAIPKREVMEQPCFSISFVQPDIYLSYAEHMIGE